MTDLYRFPKWLLHERFELEHYPDGATRFCVRLFATGSKTNFSEGRGMSVAEAAKAARVKREGTK